jgi:hypothetical protein
MYGEEIWKTLTAVHFGEMFSSLSRPEAQRIFEEYVQKTRIDMKSIERLSKMRLRMVLGIGGPRGC